LCSLNGNLNTRFTAIIAAILVYAFSCVAVTAERSGQRQSIQMRVTAYCPCSKCCGEYADGITASGYEIQPGACFVAADRRFAFGTKMIIPGYNNSLAVEVLDRGGAIQGNRLDVFFATHSEALEWGVQHLNIEIQSK